MNPEKRNKRARDKSKLARINRMIRNARISREKEKFKKNDTREYAVIPASAFETPEKKNGN